MKKYLVICGLIVTACISSNFATASGFPTQAGVDKIQIPGAGGSITTASTAGDNIVNVVKNAINYALGFLAFIAIVILIVAGFKMLLNAGDDKAQEGAQKVVKNVAIALIFIGASWLIVSFIFWIIGLLTKTT